MTRDSNKASAFAKSRGQDSSKQFKLKGHELQLVAALDPTRALYFSIVVEKNSISLAAKALGVNASTVSRKLDELEEALGVRLLERGTRNVKPTEAGETYLHYVNKALGVLEVGQQTMERYKSELSGRLRVQCPPAIGRQMVADLMFAFGRLHPDLQLSLVLDPKPPSLAESEFDVTLRFGLPVEDRAVVSKLGELTRGFVASPQFLLTHGTPDSIQSLAKLPMAAVFYDDTPIDRVPLVNAQGEWAYARTQLAANDSEVVLRAAINGDVVGRVMHWYCAEQLLTGQLVKVMPELDDTKVLYTVIAARKGNPRKVQVFVDFLKIHLTQELLNAQNKALKVAQTSD